MSALFLKIGCFYSSGRGGRHVTRVIDSDEIIYVVRGELYMFEGEKHFRIAPGEWLRLHRGIRHGGDAPYGRALSFFWVHFQPEGPEEPELPQHGRSDPSSSLPEYFQALLREQSRTRSDDNIKQLLLLLILREMARGGDLAPEQEHSALPAAADRLIRLHFFEKLPPAIIGRALKCNPTYLGRLYHRTRGETLAAAVNRCRVEEAAKLLGEGSMSIKEAAMQSGFNDMAYFRRKFKSFYGMLPGDFRRNSQLGAVNVEAAHELPHETISR